MIVPGRSILNQCLRLRQHALAPSCLLCGAAAGLDNLCGACRTELPYLPAEHCPRCAAPSLDAAVCGACLRRPPDFDHALAACEYAFPIDRLIRRYKFDHYLAAAPLLAALMGDAIARRGERADLVVPVPLSEARLRERGFNQALELARLLAVRFDIPLAATACTRLRHGDPQSRLPVEKRSANVRGAFGCVQDLRGLTVAVVDDVLTSGATLSELARVLRRAGATRVVGWVAARTPAPGG